MVSGKWKLILLFPMHDGGKRYYQLHRLVPQLSEGMFVRSLRELAQDNLSHRTIYNKVPARVECALTDDGATLLLVLGFISDWWNRRS